MYLVTMAYVNAPSAVCVTTTSTGGKFSPVSNFMELHVLTLVATLIRSWPLLIQFSITTITAIQSNSGTVYLTKVRTWPQDMIHAR